MILRPLNHSVHLRGQEEPMMSGTGTVAGNLAALKRAKNVVLGPAYTDALALGASADAADASVIHGELPVEAVGLVDGVALWIEPVVGRQDGTGEQIDGIGLVVEAGYSCLDSHLDYTSMNCPCRHSRWGLQGAGE